jgi:DHA2 family multidrug resistance protein
MMNLSRNIGGSIGISFMTTYIARQAQRHQADLAAHATRFDQPFNALSRGIAAGLRHAGVAAADAAQRADAQVYRELVRQATTLAYIDVIAVMSVAAACALPLVLLLKANVPGKGTMGH